MKKDVFIPCIVALLVFAGCKKDNKEPPSFVISGNVEHNGQALSVRSGGVELELWQYGYQLRNKIPVYLNQDGTFNAKVFPGNYKLTLLRGNGPWADKTDSLDVEVKGTSTVKVPVSPYFIIKNVNYQRNGNAITATFNLERVNTTKPLELARIYIGQTLITDQNNNLANASKAASAIIDLSQPVTITANIPAASASRDFVFVRVGVKTAGVAELLYSQPLELKLK